MKTTFSSKKILRKNAFLFNVILFLANFLI